MTFTAPNVGITGITGESDTANGKLDDAVELLKNTGYTEIAGRLENELVENPDPAE